MSWPYNIYFLTNVIAFAVMAAVAAYSLKNRSVAGAKSFLVLALLLAWGILADGLAMISYSEAMARIWFSMRFVTLAGVPPVWLLFTLHYTGRDNRLTPARYVMLFTVPVLTQAVLWTNGLHGLWVAHDVGFLREGHFMIADISARVPGPWFMVHTMFGYLCLIFGIALIFQWSYHMMRIYRAQAMALWIGMIIMTVGSAIPTFKFIPGLKVNPVIQSLVVSSLLFAWATFRYRFLDIVPVARDKLIDSMDDCMIVIDQQNRIVDINPPMQNLLGEAFSEKLLAKPANMIGQPVDSLLAPWRDFIGKLLSISSIQEELTLDINGSERFFDLRISPLINRNNQQSGRVIVLRNITGRKRVEKEHALSEARLDALYKLSQTEFPTEKETIDYALEEAVRLTGSQYGYFHLVKDDQESLELVTWSGEVMKSCTTVTDRHYPLSMAGVWADCARTKQPALHNDYQNLPERKGYPEGHSPIVRHVSVPIVHKNRVEAISGVANKETLYNDSDVRQLQLFMDGVWKIIERKRAQEELALALKEKEDLLRDLMISERMLKERNEKMEEDLKIAQAAQKGIMKSDSPVCSRIAVDFRYKPLDRVGGDYFSFFTSPDDTMGLFIGDVAGHGIAAALFTALLKASTSRAFRKHGGTPSLFMKNLNKELLDYMTTYFVTGIYGIWTPCSSEEYVTFNFTVGAHPFPVIRSRNGDFRFSGVSNDIIGLTNDVSYIDNVETLAPGDRVFLYTDGVPETINPRRETIGFGEELINVFREADRPALSDTLDAIFEILARYREGDPIHDDITVIAIEVI